MLIKLEERAYLRAMLDLISNDLSLDELRNMHRVLSVTDAEVRKKNIRRDGDTFRWENDLGEEIIIPNNIKELVVGVLNKLDSEGSFREEWTDLYELFLGEE